MRETPNLDFRYADCDNLVHAPEGTHAAIGREVALWLEKRMRLGAVAAGLKSGLESEQQALCPGCYTLILINALLELAQSQGQDVRERCLYMAREFARLAEEAAKGEPLLIAIEGDKL